MGDSGVEHRSAQGGTGNGSDADAVPRGGFCLLDPAGTLRYISPSCTDLIGRPCETLIGAALGDALPYISPRALARHLAQTLTSGEDHLRASHSRPDGSGLTLDIFSALITLGGEHWLLVFVNPIREASAPQGGRDGCERRYRQSVDGSLDVIFQTDAEARWTFLNSAWTDVTGHPVDESLGRSFLEFIHPEDREQCRDMLDSLVRRERASCLHELRYLSRDGEWRWIELHARALSDGDEQLGTGGTLRDITARKRAESELRTSEERYRQMFNGNNAVQLIIDPGRGAIVDANPAAAEFYGYPLDRLRQLSISDINVMRAEQIATEMHQAHEQRRNHFFFVHRLADGQLRNVEVHSSPVRIGEEDYLYSIVHDVTDRIRAEEALRHSEAQLRLITDSLPVLVTYIDAQGRYRFNNRTYSEWLGHSPEDLNGRHVQDVLGEIAYSRIAKQLESALRGQRMSFETEMTFKDGSIRYLFIEYVPDIAPDGAINGTVALVTDMTERKRAQDELVERTASLQMLTYQVPAVLWTTDRSLRFTSSSGAALARLGLAPNQVVGMTTYEYLGTDSASFEPNAAHRKALDGEPSQYLFEWNGLTFDCFVEPLRDADGQIAGTIGLALDRTEQHLAASALRESEERFRTAFHTSPDAITISRLRDGLVIDVNDGFLASTGYTREEVIGKTTDDIKLWHDIANRHELVHKLVRDGELQNMEAVFTTKSGKQRTGLLSAKIIHLGGEPHILAVTRDIEESKQAERALERSTAEWTYAMDFLEDGLCLLDLDGHLVRANRAFRDLFGGDDEIQAGQDIVALLEPIADADCPICRACRAREDTSEVLEADNPNNPTDRPVEVILRVIRGERGRPTGFLLGLRDLTRTRRTEMELRRLNSHIGLLLESAGEGIYGVDRVGRCTFINQAALDMLGYEREAVIGRFMHELAHHTHVDGSHFPFEESAVFKTLAESKSCRIDNEVMWNQGHTSFPVEYSSYPIHDEGRTIGAVVVFRNVTEARAMVHKMDYLASHDMLTGLVNRHEFERRLGHALELSRQEKAEHALCYMDLDQFKIVNDTCGHVAGDELLRQLGAVLHGRLRQGDTLARLGGDEFGILLEYCPMGKALAVIDDLRKTIDEFRFVWEGKAFAIGASVGAVSMTDETDSIAAALSAADAACYLAKESGRNRVHVYQINDTELALRHGEMQWVSRIQDAIECDRFELNHQPFVALNGKAKGECFEILLRMVGNDGHLIPPGAFLPAAERYNLMPAIDRWVVRHTLKWFAEHRGRLETLNLCTINLSGHTLADDAFPGFVVGQLKEYAIPAQKICFEITETTAIANLSRAVVFIGALRRLGCRFALDDFGSGMSSFAYLKNLPLDLLKIDGNFVRDIVADPIDRAMVEAINRVGHVMGIQTIAEHVEDEATLELLRQMGVDYAQGYHLGGPCALDSAPAR